MRNRSTLVAILALVVGLSGCRGMIPRSFRESGPAEYQRRRAQQFDPYPENEPGPAIVGGRPQGYDKPPAEATRARPRTGYLGR